MFRKSLATVIMMLLVCLLFLLGCTKDQSTNPLEKGKEQQEAEVIKLVGGDWGYPNPYTYYPRGPGSRKMSLLFDTLVTSDAEGNISPRLAEHWQVSTDGLVYTFKLRSGVKWQDGQSFTVKDVVFSYEYEKRYPPVAVLDFSAIKKLESVDDQTIRITLVQPDPDFVASLSSFTIIPKHIWEKVTDPYNFVASEAAVGTGPYQLIDYSKEHGIYRFEAREDFWGSKPRVKVIQCVPVSEEILAFQQGQIDRISIKPDLLARFANNPEYRIINYETTWAYRLYFNMKLLPELSEKKFRQALVYAINRQELVEKVERGAAVPGNPGVLHPNNKLYNPGASQYPYNQQKAKDLLASLGYQDTNSDGIREKSNGEKLSFRLLADEGSTRLAELIKQQLALVGIEVKVQVVELKTRDARFKKGDFELCINGSGGGEDLKELSSKSKTGDRSTTAMVIGYHNPELDKLFFAQKQESNPAKRKELMAKLQEVAAEDLPKLTLYYRNSLAVHRPSVYDGWSKETYHNDARINFVAD